MALTTEDKKYFEQITGAYYEALHTEIKKGLEIASSKPDSDEVREIVREEVWPIHQEIRTFKEEMILLRKDVDRHEKDIKQLKLKAA